MQILFNNIPVIPVKNSIALNKPYIKSEPLFGISGRDYLALTRKDEFIREYLDRNKNRKVEDLIPYFNQDNRAKEAVGSPITIAMVYAAVKKLAASGELIKRNSGASTEKKNAARKETAANRARNYREKLERKQTKQLAENPPKREQGQSSSQTQGEARRSLSPRRPPSPSDVALFRIR